jgi:hypothetical protein
MSVLEGKNTAITVAKSSLAKINLEERFRIHGFQPFQNGKILIRLFGKDARFYESNHDLIYSDTRESAKTNHHILFLHYLLCDIPINPANQLITFRQIPGGQFYWSSFIAKTIKPLVNFIGNDIEKLKNKLSKFDWKPENIGDFSARIHALGKIHVLLIYHVGDEEFPASADILFDSSILRVYKAEDVSVLSSEICLGIIKG